jgi:hypothetical protein
MMASCFLVSAISTRTNCLVGRNIQIDYVLQRHRKKNSVPNEEHKVVVEIRVEAPQGEDIPGEYQRLLAAEIAQQVC